MFRPSILWLQVLSCLAVFGQQQDDSFKTVPLRTHSLYQPYLDSDLQSRWFDYGGSTISECNRLCFVNAQLFLMVANISSSHLVRADQ